MQHCCRCLAPLAKLFSAWLIRFDIRHFSSWIGNPQGWDAHQEGHQLQGQLQSERVQFQPECQASAVPCRTCSILSLLVTFDRSRFTRMSLTRTTLWYDTNPLHSLGPGGAWVDVPSGLGLEALAPGRIKTWAGDCLCLGKLGTVGKGPRTGLGHGDPCGVEKQRGRVRS